MGYQSSVPIFAVAEDFLLVPQIYSGGYLWTHGIALALRNVPNIAQANDNVNAFYVNAGGNLAPGVRPLFRVPGLPILVGQEFLQVVHGLEKVRHLQALSCGAEQLFDLFVRERNLAYINRRRGADVYSLTWDHAGNIQHFLYEHAYRGCVQPMNHLLTYPRVTWPKCCLPAPYHLFLPVENLPVSSFLGNFSRSVRPGNLPSSAGYYYPRILNAYDLDGTIWRQFFEYYANPPAQVEIYKVLRWDAELPQFRGPEPRVVQWDQVVADNQVPGREWRAQMRAIIAEKRELARIAQLQADREFYRVRNLPSVFAYMVESRRHALEVLGRISWTIACILTRNSANALFWF